MTRSVEKSAKSPEPRLHPPRALGTRRNASPPSATATPFQTLRVAPLPTRERDQRGSSERRCAGHHSNDSDWFSRFTREVGCRIRRVPPRMCGRGYAVRDDAAPCGRVAQSSVPIRPRLHLCRELACRETDRDGRAMARRRTAIGDLDDRGGETPGLVDELATQQLCASERSTSARATAGTRTVSQPVARRRVAIFIRRSKAKVSGKKSYVRETSGARFGEQGSGARFGSTVREHGSGAESSAIRQPRHAVRAHRSRTSSIDDRP
jgi:hypothetical protein